MEKLIPLTQEHLPHLIENLREWDRKELQSFRDITIEEGLSELVGYGQVWLSPKGNPCVVCGLVPHEDYEDVGVPFLLATEEFYTHTRKFARESKLWINEALLVYPTLFNVVAADNIKAVRWLRWLGFDIEERVDNLGRFGLSFYPFYMRR
jgi:ribosomal protein S18 acetylase RimI-like enzyme